MTDFEDFSFDVLSPDIAEEEAKQLLAEAGLPTIPRMSVNCYVVEDGRRTVLIDTGDANCLGSGDKLQGALAVAKVDPRKIDSVLLTHAHPDHLGGLIEHGVALFPNAELILYENELRFCERRQQLQPCPATNSCSS